MGREHQPRTCGQPTAVRNGRPAQRSRAILAAPFVALLLWLSCGGGGGGTATVAPPALPPSIASFSATPASVLSGQNATLAWSVSGATSLSIDQGVGAVSGASLSVHPATTTTYTLTASNGAGAATATTTLQVQPAVVVSSFTAARSPITAGAGTTLTAVFSNAVSASIEPGVGTVASGQAYAIQPTGTTTYTLTVTGPGGPVVRSLTVTVVPAPSISQFTAAPATVAPGTSSQITAVFTGGAGSLDHGLGPVESGVPVATGPLAETTAFRLTVTNAAGDTATRTAQVTVGAGPAISGFSAAKAILTQGSTTTLTPVFSNAVSASIDHGVGSVTSGTSYSVRPGGTTTYTLTVNGPGGSATRALTLTVVPPATLSSFGASPGSILPGAASQLIASFADGSGSIDHGIGPVTSGAPVSTGALATSTTYQLTVTNPAGDSLLASTTVVVGSAVEITALTAAKSTLTAGSVTTLTPVFVNATGATLEPGIGSVSSGGAYTVNPSATTTYTLTAQGLGGPVSRTLTIVVFPAPSIASFSASPSTVLSGGGSQLTATFSDGSGEIDHGLGPVGSGLPVATGGLAASTTFLLTVTNPAGDSVTASATVTVGSAVAITGFSAARGTITAGSSTTLSAAFVNAAGASIDQGVGPVAQGVPVTVSPAATTTYTLTALGLGGPVTAAVTVTVVPPASISSFTAAPTAVPTGSTSQLTAVFSGGTGGIDHGVGAVASGAPVSIGPLSASTAYVLTVTNPAGDATTATATVTVGSAVAITGFTAARSTLTAGSSTTLTAAFVNATGASIDQGVGPVSPGLPVTVNPAATTTYTLTAQGLGGPVTATVTVTVVPAASISAFTANPARIISGGSTQLTATFTGGTGSIDHGLGALSSGSPVSVSPAINTAYLLTVTNAAGDSVTATLLVAVDFLVTFAAGPGGSLAGALSQQVPSGAACSAVTAVPNAGFAFAAWSGPGFLASTANPLTVASVGQNLAVTATFVPLSHTVTFVAGPHGSLSGTLSQTVAHGGSCTAVTAVPNGGYALLDWTGTAGFTTATGNPLTVANVTSDLTITANFAQAYTVTFVVSGTGSLLGSTSQVVASGGSCSAVTAVPGAGWAFLNWTGTGGFVTTTTNPLTVTGVTANLTLFANFSRLPVIGSFSAAAPTINLGQAAVLSWTGVSYFTTASIDNGGGPVSSPNGMVGPYPAATTTYTLTATNAVGTTTASVTVTVIQKPVIASFTASPAAIAAGQASTLSWSVTGTGVSCSLDQGIGPVAGPSRDVNPVTTTTYTLTATNSAGSRTATATVTVGLAPPSGLGYAANPAVYTKGTAIAPNAPSSGGGAAASYGVAPSLPAGLSLHPTTGVLSGTPTAVTSTATYIVTASNASGSTTCGLSLAVKDVPPSIGYSSGAYTFVVGTAIAPLTPSHSGGAVVAWEVSPPLPSGLNFNTSTGVISGTPAVVAAVAAYTITATNSGGSSSVSPTIAVNPPGPAITVQPFSQILAIGASPNLSVTASGTGTLTYQWSRNGIPMAGATGPSCPVAAFSLADDGAVYAVVVQDSFGGSTPSEPAKLSLFQDLTTWLSAHPAVAGAIKWQFQAASGPKGAYQEPAESDKIAWTGWSASQKADLDQAYLDAIAWFNLGAPQVAMADGAAGQTSLTDRPWNIHPSAHDPSSSTLVIVERPYMWKLYLAHVAFSLMLETSRQVPWTVTDYPDSSLKWIFDSATLGWYLSNWDGFSLGTYDNAGRPTLRTHNRPRTTFADPRWTWPWLKQAGIIGGSRLGTVVNTLDWMRSHMYHFLGSENIGTDLAVWQYNGYSPLSRIVNGTIDSNHASIGTQHFTAGCHGSTGFLNAALRVVNIPVQPIWACDHELVYFMSEDLYMDHADNPYNGNVRASFTSSLLLMIDSATWRSRFGGDESVNHLDNSSPVCAWIGYTAAHFP